MPASTEDISKFQLVQISFGARLIYMIILYKGVPEAWGQWEQQVPLVKPFVSHVLQEECNEKEMNINILSFDHKVLGNF